MHQIAIFILSLHIGIGIQFKHISIGMQTNILVRKLVNRILFCADIQ